MAEIKTFGNIPIDVTDDYIFEQLRRSADAGNEVAALFGWVAGNISNGADSQVNEAYRIRTEGFYETSYVDCLSVDATKHKYVLAINYYDASQEFVTRVIDIAPPVSNVYPINKSYPYYRLVLLNNDNGDSLGLISPSEGVVVTAMRLPQAEKLERRFDDLSLDMGWHQGTIDTTTGLPTASGARLYSELIDCSNMYMIEVEVGDGYRVVFDWYDQDKALIPVGYEYSTSWISYSRAFYTPTEAKYFRVVVSNTSNTSITPSDGQNVKLTATSLNSDKAYYGTQLLNSDVYDFGWVIGTLGDGNGREAASTTRIRSKMVPCGAGSKIIVHYGGNGARQYGALRVFEYDKYGNYLSQSDWSTEPYTVQNDGHVRILLRQYVNNVITEDTMSMYTETVQMYWQFPIDDIKSLYASQDPLAPWFVDNVSSGISKVKTNMESIGKNGTTFLFFTDVHYGSRDIHDHYGVFGANNRRSANMIKNVVDGCGLREVVCGGDLITFYDDNSGESPNDGESRAIKSLRDFVDEYRIYELGVKCVKGNHDRNTATNTGVAQTYALTEAQYFGIVQCGLRDNVVLGGYFYYYWDDNVTNTRYVVLDTGDDAVISQEQFSWFDGVLSDGSDKNIIVIAHWLYEPNDYANPLSGGDFTPSAETLMTKCDNAGNVKAIIFGHIHADFSARTDGGIPMVATDCDSVGTHSSYGATSNTVTEQCFDVMTVDYSSGSVKCVRFGRGVDRVVS